MYKVRLTYQLDEFDSLHDDDLDLFYDCHSFSKDVYTYPECDLENVGVILNDIYIDIKNGACKNLICIDVVRYDVVD